MGAEVRGKYQERNEAIRLRVEEGLSFPEISKLLNVSKGTLSAWLSGIDISDDQKLAMAQRSRARGGVAMFAGAETNRRRGLEKRESYREEGRQAAKMGNSLHQMGCVLYWAEGVKGRNSASFVNGDPVMMRSFSRFLFGPVVKADPRKASFSVGCYVDILTMSEIEEFWVEQIGFDLRSTKHRVKPTRVERLAFCHPKRPHGICPLHINDTRVVQHIYGALEVYAGVHLNPVR